MEQLSPELQHTQFQSLRSVFSRIVSQHGDLPAYTCLGKTLSYAEVDRLSDAFATWLCQQDNLSPGDRIAIQLPNLLQFPVALFGALKAGLVVVNTNPLYTAPEMCHQFKDSAAKAIVILSSMCSKLQEVLPETGIEVVIVTQLGDLQGGLKRIALNAVARYVKKMVPAYQLPQALDFETLLNTPVNKSLYPAEANPDDLALLLYTGGTTGVAKGAMLSHRNLTANMMQLRSRCLLIMKDREETIAAPLPLYHSYAFLLHCLAMPFAGIHNVLIPDPRNISEVLQLWKKYQFSGFVGINTLYLALMRNKAFDELNFKPLTFCGAGGMAMSTSVLSEWKTRTGCEIIEGYGLTECSPVVSVNVPGKVKPGTVGPVVPETEVKLVDDEGKDVAADDRGELWIKGPQVMKGYWQQEAASAEALTSDGWFKSGDYATIDGDGYISIVDRKKDMILVSGFNVFPNEVEDWVNTHDKVMECAAIGVENERTGEAIKLFVVARDKSLTADEVIAHSKAGLTAYKIPREIVFVEDLPKSNVGKILRRELRDEN